MQCHGITWCRALFELYWLSEDRLGNNDESHSYHLVWKTVLFILIYGTNENINPPLLLCCKLICVANPCLLDPQPLKWHFLCLTHIVLKPSTNLWRRLFANCRRDAFVIVDNSKERFVGVDVNNVKVHAFSSHCRVWERSSLVCSLVYWFGN